MIYLQPLRRRATRPLHGVCGSRESLERGTLLKVRGQSQFRRARHRSAVCHGPPRLVHGGPLTSFLCVWENLWCHSRYHRFLGVPSHCVCAQILCSSVRTRWCHDCVRHPLRPAGTFDAVRFRIRGKRRQEPVALRRQQEEKWDRHYFIVKHWCLAWHLRHPFKKIAVSDQHSEHPGHDSRKAEENPFARHVRDAVSQCATKVCVGALRI